MERFRHDPHCLNPGLKLQRFSRVGAHISERGYLADRNRHAREPFPTPRRAAHAHRLHGRRVTDYPSLIWRWYIEQPIESPLDERTREGDDHPARLYLVFRTASGEERRMEIIWGNKLNAGDYKYIGGFPHYVADGGNENIHQWRREEVDLIEVYRQIWPDGAPAHLIDIAIFCDSDETHGHTVSYFAARSFLRKCMTRSRTPSLLVISRTDDGPCQLKCGLVVWPGSIV
jgi:hypothetical protein